MKRGGPSPASLRSATSPRCAGRGGSVPSVPPRLCGESSVVDLLVPHEAEHDFEEDEQHHGRFQ